MLTDSQKYKVDFFKKKFKEEGGIHDRYKRIKNIS